MIDDFVIAADLLVSGSISFNIFRSISLFLSRRLSLPVDLRGAIVGQLLCCQIFRVISRVKGQ